MDKPRGPHGRDFHRKCSMSNPSKFLMLPTNSLRSLVLSLAKAGPLPSEQSQIVEHTSWTLRPARLRAQKTHLWSEGDTQWSLRILHSWAQRLDRAGSLLSSCLPKWLYQIFVPHPLDSKIPGPLKDTKASFTFAGPPDHFHKCLKEQYQTREWGS